MVAAAVFSDRAAALAQTVAARLPWRTARRAGISLTEAMRRYSNHHVELVRVLLASAGVQAIRVVQAYCLGRALAIDLPLGTYFLLIPVVLLVMLLPITVSGLGTSQVAFQYLFGQAGVAAPQAVALSILFVALGVVGNLPGSVLYAFDAHRPFDNAQDRRADDRRQGSDDEARRSRGCDPGALDACGALVRGSVSVPSCTRSSTSSPFFPACRSVSRSSAAATPRHGSAARCSDMA